MGASRLMGRGRKPSNQYAAVLNWIDKKAEVGGPGYVWARFGNAEEAKAAMRRLSSCLRTQVQTEPGTRISIRRSELPSGKCEVVVFLYSEPSTVVRMPQGQRS